MLKAHSPRGTRDILGQESVLKTHILKTFYDMARLYHFHKIETPIFEHTGVFQRTLGETSDIVGKEMYTFQDKGGDSLTLRPEGTAPVMRALISNGLTQTLPQKFCYDGPMFRYERPQKGRYRQLHQAGLEYIGAQSPYADIEIMSFGYAFVQKLGLGETTLHINTLGDTQSRLAYRKALVDYFTPIRQNLSQDSQFRLEHNPLRILDSKNAEDKKLCEQAPKYQNYLNQESKDFFNVVLKGLDQLNIPYTIERSLVRGLDYYCHTAFEFKTNALGAQDAVMAGGRYDHLAEQMGGPGIPAVGLGMGIDRLCLLMEDANSNTLPKQPAIIGIIPAGDSEFPQALALTYQLRNHNIPIEFPLSGNMSKRFKQLDKAGCSHAVILGDEELKQHKVTIKNLRMNQDSEKQIDVSFDNVADYLKNICGI